MLKSVVAVLLVGALAALPAVASTITDRQACEVALSYVQKMRTSNNAGPRANKESDLMIAAAGAQCQNGDYVEAEKTMLKLRALLVTE